MDTHRFYKAVSIHSVVADSLLDYARTAPPTLWVNYYHFQAIPVHPNQWMHDRFLNQLSQKRTFHAGVLRMPPNTCYNWHVDSDRRCGVNMLLSDDNQSRCLFVDGEPNMVFATQELKYQPNTYYAFNTQIPHMVLNTTQPRYLFSLEFLEKDRGLTFDQLCEDVRELK